MSLLEIKKALEVMITPGDVVELRIFEQGDKKICGWFNNIDRMAEAALSHDATAEGTYYTCNACTPDMLAIANNRILPCKTASNEKNMIRRRIIGIDIDPRRNPVKISSTDEEHNLSILLALEIKEWLKAQGWPDPVIGDSGNGAHLDYFVDLPVTEDIKALYKRFFVFLKSKFSTDKVDVQGFEDANRVWKVYGTMARKGENLSNRPHRKSSIIEIPNEKILVTLEQITAIAGNAPEILQNGKTAEMQQPSNIQKHAWDPEKLKEWFGKYNIEIARTKTEGGRTYFILKSCMFNPEHTGNKEAEVHIDANGVIGYKCHHDSCKGRSWIEARELLEPNYRNNGNGNGNGKEIPQQYEYEPEPLKEEIEIIQERRMKLDLPDDHFLSQYMRWGKSVTDAYEEYHIGNGFWLLSASTSRRVVLKLRQEYIRPNIWIMALGNSTTSRKSTAVNKARKMFESATDMSLPNEDYSLEGYLENLSERPIMHNVRDEASGLLEKFHQRYNDGIFAFECTIYDGSPEKLEKRLSSGRAKEPKTYTISNYYVTKLYATTPDKLSTCMTVSDFQCGYGYRWLLNYPKYKHDRKPLEMERPEDVEAWGIILKRIKEFYILFQKEGDIEFKASNEVMQYYDRICIEMEQRAEEQNSDILNSVIGRSQIHILKIAMLLELGKRVVSTTLTEESIKLAAQMVTDYFIPSIMETIERIQEDIKNNFIEKITAILRRLGGIASHTKLLRDSHLKSRDFTECISTMCESHSIKIECDKPRSYRLVSHNNGLDLRSVRNVRDVRIYTQGDNTSANIAKMTSKGMDHVTPGGRIEDSMLTCEPGELCEPCEKSTDNPFPELYFAELTKLLLDFKDKWGKGPVNSSNDVEFAMKFVDIHKPQWQASGETGYYTCLGIKRIADKLFKITPEAARS